MRPCPSRRSHLFPYLCTPSALLALTSLGTALPVTAQDTEPAELGYITAVTPPDSFEINRTRVVISDQTSFGLIGAKETVAGDPLRQKAVQVGAYAQVFGPEHAHTITAKTVLFRDDATRKLTGLGVVERVMASGPQPVFEADGYRIRITPATQTSFHGDLKSLDSVAAGIWVNYEGTRDSSGDLVAIKVSFLPPEPAGVKAAKYLEVMPFHFEPPRSTLQANAASNTGDQPPYDVSDQEAVLTQDGSVRFGPVGKTHKIPADQKLQSRIRRIGMSLVPAYQKQLPPHDLAKIPFQFYAVDDDKAHSELCSTEGLILIPLQLVDRLKSDDRIAAILADGIAFNLQRQASRLIVNSREYLGVEAAALTAGSMVPGLGPPILIGDEISVSKAQTAMQEDRGRVALALMADAGYNPWQAPEAWRLAAAKKVPAKLDSLKYPELGGYQLGILHLQYQMKAAAEGGRATLARSTNASQESANPATQQP
jgi:hypothetical protein